MARLLLVPMCHDMAALKATQRLIFTPGLGMLLTYQLPYVTDKTGTLQFITKSIKLSWLTGKNPTESVNGWIMLI